MRTKPDMTRGGLLADGIHCQSRTAACLTRTDGHDNQARHEKGSDFSLMKLSGAQETSMPSCAWCQDGPTAGEWQSRTFLDFQIDWDSSACAASLRDLALTTPCGQGSRHGVSPGSAASLCAATGEAGGCRCSEAELALPGSDACNRTE